MVASAATDDHGFVMIDVMAATAVLAIAGAAAIASMTAWIQQQNGLLDRSVEIVNMASFVETLSLTGYAEAEHDWTDGTFDYEVSPVTPAEPVNGLVQVYIRSMDRAGRVSSSYQVWLPK